MRLVHRQIFSKIVFEENKVNVLAVENPDLLTELVLDFQNQTNGGEGGFVLSANEYELLNLSKQAQFVPQPLLIDINDKKIVNKLYSSLKEIAFNGEYYPKTTSLFSQIVQYIQQLCSQTDYDIDTDDTVDIGSLFKAVGLRFYNQDATPAEKLLDYMLTVRELLNVNLFVVLNLKSYLNTEQLALFEKSVLDYKLNLLLLENIHRSKTEYEKILIIDRDLCEM